MADIQVTQSSLAVFLIVGAIGLAAMIAVAVGLFGARVPKSTRRSESAAPADNGANEAPSTPTTRQG